MRLHRCNMASATCTDDDTLENTRELLFDGGGQAPLTPPPQRKLRSATVKERQIETYL